MAALKEVAVALLVVWVALMSACGKPNDKAPASNEHETPQNSLAPQVPPPSARSPESGQTLSASAPAEAIEVAIEAGAVELEGKRVEVERFWIDKTEVTVEAYLKCLESTRCTKPKTDSTLCNWKQREARLQHPVNCVTHAQATAFCKSLGRRLPSAAEWQLAAGGAEQRTYPWGAERPSNLWFDDAAEETPGPARHRLCWTGDGTDTAREYTKTTCAVRSYREGDTPSGIADMSGNVAEWTAESQKLPMGSTAYLVYGGGFLYEPLGILKVRVQDSLPMPADTYGPDIGFRCVR